MATFCYFEISKNGFVVRGRKESLLMYAFLPCFLSFLFTSLFSFFSIISLLVISVFLL